MLLEPQTWPFTVATVLLLLIAITEGLALLLGSTANDVLHGAPCDVLAVRLLKKE